MDEKWHYYEAHVTIEPIFGTRLKNFKEICLKYNFHVAALLMKKRPKDTAARSRYDSFCTGRSKSFEELKKRMLELVRELLKNNFQIWRYKIEDVLLDSRYDDSNYPLDREKLPETERNPRSPL